MSQLLLRKITIEDEAVCMQAQAELAADDFEFIYDFAKHANWQAFIERNNLNALGIDLQEDRVPDDLMVAVVDDEIVGRASIRHGLNDFLSKYGGHIGYAVRPDFRGRGYATEILEASLRRAKEVGLQKVLVTCFDENFASARVIEKCGGVLESIIEYPDGRPFRRYWIEIS